MSIPATVASSRQSESEEEMIGAATAARGRTALFTTSRLVATSARRSFATTWTARSTWACWRAAGEKFRFRLLSYCLMTNHVHLAIRTGEEPLSRIMARLHSIYAEWFNRRHEPPPVVGVLSEHLEHRQHRSCSAARSLRSAGSHSRDQPFSLLLYRIGKHLVIMDTGEMRPEFLNLRVPTLDHECRSVRHAMRHRGAQSTTQFLDRRSRRV